MKFWNFIDKFYKILAIFGIIFATLPIWNSIYKSIKQGIIVKVPFYLILLSSFISLIVGLLIGRNQRKKIIIPTFPGHLKIENSKDTIKPIMFNYQDSPAHHKWNVDTGKYKRNYPNFTYQTDSNNEIFLRIKEKGRYNMDYILDPAQQIAEEVIFRVHLFDNSLLYIRVRIIEKSSNQTRSLWLRLDYSNQPKRAERFNDNEYVIYVDPSIKKNDWYVLSVKSKNEIHNIVDFENYNYDIMQAVRFRGDLDIHSIHFKGT